MKKIPFKVSARAARLIGAENISNAESAIIELIKNSYDADANNCVVYFEHLFTEFECKLKDKELQFLLDIEDFKKFENLFEKVDDSTHEIKKEISDDTKTNIKDYISSLCRIWIIDDGIGMTEDIIASSWMTIGTNNKEKEPVSVKYDRIKSGAKGLGRFALDKLGKRSYVYIHPDPLIHEEIEKEEYLEWSNTWDDFLQDGKTLDAVEASLSSKTAIDPFHQTYVPSYVFSTSKLEEEISFESYGVIICCDINKEDWHKQRMLRLKRSLETLIPPSEKEPFCLFFLSNKYEDLNSRITSSINSNFDYKIVSKVDNDKTVTIEIERNEFETSKFPDEFFSTKEFLALDNSKSDFIRGKSTKKLTLSNLLPNVKEDLLSSVGPLKITFYFAKQGSPTKEEKQKLFYKDLDIQARKNWQETFGGIRVFRDNFRVRPYGEPGSSKDWLGLGDRAASSPAGIGKSTKAWRVRPNQISGIVEISRIENPQLSDKSSREGLQENQQFDLFKSIIISTIAIFEKDRANIGFALRKTIAELGEDERETKEADKIAQRELEHASDKSRNEDKSEIQKLATQYQRNKEVLRELREEQKMLRSLATIGIVSTAFSHELKNIHGKLGKRFVPISAALKLASSEDPFIQSKITSAIQLLDIYKEQDGSVKDWINFSLLGMKKDKRKRKKIILDLYFKQLENNWKRKFDERQISFTYSSSKNETAFKCFEIDLDCIFNNLLINSIEAFSQKTSPSDRGISIILEEKESSTIIKYRDTGPGLSKSISNPEDIFDCFYTTKLNEYSGEEEGTGIGMWMVKSTINEYKGETKLHSNTNGFYLEIIFPH
ncbi:MAG: sensor histidine kinase [Pseudomonadota bacterium]|nr:sensor histidine kinase [Pseudomonadota bacterium]